METRWGNARRANFLAGSGADDRGAQAVAEGGDEPTDSPIGDVISESLRTPGEKQCLHVSKISRMKSHSSRLSLGGLVTNAGYCLNFMAS